MEPIVREPEAKRRKVRKGTRSCWECKGRKFRCTYMTAEDTVCDGCIRRGTSCVSQELPEQPLAAVDKRRQIRNRMVRVEAIVERLVKGADDRRPVTDASISEPGVGVSFSPEVPTQSSTETAPTPHTSSTLCPKVDALGWYSPAVTSPSTHTSEQPEASDLVKYQKISEVLLATYPSQENVKTIVQTAGPMPSFFHQMVRKPYKDFRFDEKDKHDLLAELIIRHTSKTHPLIIARQMLLLAIAFRYIHPEFQRSLAGFSEPPDIVLQRIADAAIDFIMTNDEMIGTIEGLECLLLTSSFQADSGNLRAGWSANRRAMFLAQLMSLHRQTRPALKSIQPKNKWDPQFLWYRIVYYDRFFSLILGLPQGSADNSMGAAFPFEDDTPTGRLERRHCVLAGRILQRNEYDLSLNEYLDTEAIDMELRKLSESMPSKWWLIPNLASIQDGVQLFWETIKLINQVFHNILLSHLHLPFLLHPFSGPHQHRHDYSRIACVNASRDLLHRYMSLRTFSDMSYCCHSMDFHAINAAMTLLLAHLDGHRSKRDSDKALLHQRTSDRAIIEEILDNMEKVGTLNKAKTLSERGAGVLRRLLVIEADTAQGSSYRLETIDSNPSSENALHLMVPYLGSIIITPDGRNSREPLESSQYGSRNETNVPEETLQVVSSGDGLRTEAADRRLTLAESSYGADIAASTTLQQYEIRRASHEGREYQTLPTFSGMRMAKSGNIVPIAQEPVAAVGLEQPFHTGMTIDQENWASQGVDMTFFDTLMRDSDAQIQDSVDYWWAA